MEGFISAQVELDNGNYLRGFELYKKSESKFFRSFLTSKKQPNEEGSSDITARDSVS